MEVTTESRHVQKRLEHRGPMALETQSSDVHAAVLFQSSAKSNANQDATPDPTLQKSSAETRWKPIIGQNHMSLFPISSSVKRFSSKRLSATRPLFYIAHQSIISSKGIKLAAPILSSSYLITESHPGSLRERK